MMRARPAPWLCIAESPRGATRECLDRGGSGSSPSGPPTERLARGAPVSSAWRCLTAAQLRPRERRPRPTPVPRGNVSRQLCGPHHFKWRRHCTRRPRVSTAVLAIAASSRLIAARRPLDSVWVSDNSTGGAHSAARIVVARAG